MSHLCKKSYHSFPWKSLVPGEVMGVNVELQVWRGVQNGCTGRGCRLQVWGWVQNQRSMREDSVTQTLACSLSPVSYIYPLT